MAKHIEVIARGLFTRENTLLVCESVQGNYGYLPGGHVEIGEQAPQALTRELLEEANLPCKAGPLLLSAEASFTATNKKGQPKHHHEITLVFEASIDADATVTSCEPEISFRWLPISELPRYDLRPAGIRAWLVNHLDEPKSEHSSAWVSDFEN